MSPFFIMKCTYLPHTILLILTNEYNIHEYFKAIFVPSYIFESVFVHKFKYTFYSFMHKVRKQNI